MKKLLTIGLIMIGFQSFSNVNFIQFDKMENAPNYQTNINFLKENVGYFNHWTADWKYDVKKKILRDINVFRRRSSSKEVRVIKHAFPGTIIEN